MLDVSIGIPTAELRVEALPPFSVSTGLPTPLFVVSEGGVGPLATLQARVRLSGLKTDVDAYAIFVQAVTEARLTFYRRIGLNTIDSILDTPYTPTPTGVSQTLRALATATEIELVRLFLLRRLKVFFADHSAQAREVWQEDGLSRQSVSKKELAAIEERIGQNMDLLSGDVSFGNETSVSVSLLEPATKPLPAGASVWTQAQKTDWINKNG